MGEGLHRTGDLSLRDTSNFVLWEYSVGFVLFFWFTQFDQRLSAGGTSTHCSQFRHGKHSCKLLPQENRKRRTRSEGTMTPSGQLRRC